jgi:hypothetical protein
LAADRLTLYERRSLPPDLERARSLYQTWLLKAVTDVGLSEPNVNVVSSQSHRGLYNQLGFTVSGRGDIRQLTNCFTRSTKPTTCTASGGCMSNASRAPGNWTSRWPSMPSRCPRRRTWTVSANESGRLAYGDLEKYFETILSRNLKGPANNPPVIESISDQRVNTNSSVSFTVRARDPDRHDQLRYWMDADGISGAEFDRRSGQFRWRPTKPGDYRLPSM